MKLEDTNGTEYESIPQNTGFIVSAQLTELERDDSEVYMFTAVYGTDGALLALDYAKADFVENRPFTIGFHIPAQAAQIGSVRVFVWDSFAGMNALAQSVELT